VDGETFPRVDQPAVSFRRRNSYRYYFGCKTSFFNPLQQGFYSFLRGLKFSGFGSMALGSKENYPSGCFQNLVGCFSKSPVQREDVFGGIDPFLSFIMLNNWEDLKA